MLAVAPQLCWNLTWLFIRCIGTSRVLVMLFSLSLDRFHCHAIKKKSKTILCKKLRNCDVIEVNEISPSFRPVRFPKLQIFVEMFCRNLQSPVNQYGGWKIV